MACASTVAVVVPSPAVSDVLLATSRTICAPMFSSGSFSSISFATVTPSLVIVGEPNFLSGLLAIHNLFCHVSRLRRSHRLTPAQCALFRIENREHFVLAHDEVFLAIELDILPGVLPEQNRVAGLHVERHTLGLLPFTETDGDDFSLLRLFLGAIGDDDSADFLFTLVDTLDDDAVV